MAFIVLDLGGSADRLSRGGRRGCGRRPGLFSWSRAAGVVAYAVSPSGWFGKQKDPPGLGGLRDEGCSSRYSIMSVLVGTGRVITGPTYGARNPRETSRPDGGTAVPSRDHRNPAGRHTGSG